MKVRGRFLTIARLFVRMILELAKDYRLIQERGYAYAQKKMAPVHERRARDLYGSSLALGGVMIKLCQFFSARRDIFPEPYIRILSSLQDDVPPVPFAQIETVLARELGDYRSSFRSIDETPLASASLGQVHRAVLATGEEVVLKVLKPGVEELFDLDFAILDQVFRILSHFRVFTEKADFRGLLEEFIQITGDELNFRREVSVAGEFARHMGVFPYVKIPRCYGELCSRRVIVMEYLRGDKISSVEKWRHRNNDPRLIARRLLEIYFEQLLSFKLVHFDPHPGNILVTEDSNLVLIDFGMSGEITDGMRDGLREGLTAFIKRDYRRLVDVFFDQGFIRRGFNRYSLLPVVEYLFGEFLDTVKLNRESLNTADLSPIFEELVEIIYTQPFNFPVRWAFIGRTVGTVSGLVSTLNPDFLIYEEFKPLADRFLRENLADIAGKYLKQTWSNMGIMFGIPRRLDYFLGEMERGQYKFSVDYREIIEKIDETKSFAVRLLSFSACTASGAGSYLFYIRGDVLSAGIFAGAALTALLVALFYRPRSRRDRIRRWM